MANSPGSYLHFPILGSFLTAAIRHRYLHLPHCQPPVSSTPKSLAVRVAMLVAVAWVLPMIVRCLRKELGDALPRSVVVGLEEVQLQEGPGDQGARCDLVPDDLMMAAKQREGRSGAQDVAPGRSQVPLSGTTGCNGQLEMISYL